MAEVAISEFEMFSLFEMTPDLVCIAGKDGYFKKVNPAVTQKLGYTEAELFASPIASFIYPDDRPLTHQNREQLLSGKPLLNFQNRYIAKNGKIVWLEWTSIYAADKEIVFAIAKDITQRKELENDINEKYKKFKSLATHFKTSIEKDRKYLAVELHEELAQLALVIKIDINFININEPGLSDLSRNHIAHALGVSDLLMNAIRRISFAISPTMLEDLGLNDTLKWHCAEFAILNGIPCLFESDYDEAHLTHEIKLDFFRICQEALSNVMYHAEASHVKISIEDRAEELYLSVSDDGKGFDIINQQPGSGLKTMQVRASSINGRLAILTAPGKGTTVEVSVNKMSA